MNKLKQSKHASYVFNITMSLASIIILFVALFTTINSPGSTLSRSIGTKQYDILKSNIQSEADIFYLKQSAKNIFKDTKKDLFTDGGFISDSPCSKIYGPNKYYNLWNSPTQTCFPDYLATFSSLYLEELLKSPDIELQENQFTISLVNQMNTFIFSANKPLILNKSNKIFTYSYYPSFRLDLKKPFEFPLKINDAKELISNCENQPLSYISTFTQSHFWKLDIDNQLSYAGQSNDIISSPDTLKYHTFRIPYPTPILPTSYLDFALFINSDISESGESQQLTGTDTYSHTFEDSNEDEHILTIDTIGTDQISGTITSDPIPFTLSKNQEIVVDVTGDGTFDIYLRLDNIEGDQVEFTLTIFDKPPETGLIEIPELPLIPLETGNSICAKPGSYGNDFDSNVLIEWAQETGYNPCYVAAFIDGECTWNIDAVTGGYYGAFQWGKKSLIDMKKIYWGVFPLANSLDSHTQIVDMNLEQQLNLLTEYFEFRANQNNKKEKLVTLDQMYMAVAFPFCLQVDQNSEKFRNYNLDNEVSGTSAANKDAWWIPGEPGPQYATCQGVVDYAYSRAKLDPSLSFCSCECEDPNQKMCSVLSYPDVPWGYQGNSNFPFQTENIHNVLAIGDSITANGGFVDYLNENTNDEVSFTKIGYGGCSSEKIKNCILSNFGDPDCNLNCLTEPSSVQTYDLNNFDAVIILAGANDGLASSTTPNTFNNLRTINIHLETFSNIGFKHYNLLITPSGEYGPWGENKQNAIDNTNDINDQIKELYYVDTYTPLADENGICLYCSDGLHPNDEGHNKMGQAILEKYFSSYATN